MHWRADVPAGGWVFELKGGQAVALTGRRSCGRMGSRAGGGMSGKRYNDMMGVECPLRLFDGAAKSTKWRNEER